jgi:hypothetical protein
MVAVLALGFAAGCQEENISGPQSAILGEGYRPFPQDSADIPDPDTLTAYPYDPNLYIPYDFSSLNLTEYPQPDSSHLPLPGTIGSAISKDSNMIDIADFLAIERAILPETTMQRIVDSIYQTPITPNKVMTDYTNDCSFSANKRGDVLLVRNPWVPVPGFFKHAGVWLGSMPGRTGSTVIHSISNGVQYVNAEYFHHWQRCCVLRVDCWPWNDSLYRNLAANYCILQLGKPYNYNWLWKFSTSKFYCSQLAWAGYWRSGQPIDIDIYCIHYFPEFGFVPDFHVAPDEIWLNLRTFQIARSSGLWSL